MNNKLLVPSSLFPLLLALALIISACASGRKAVEEEVRERSPEFLLRQLAANQIKADWLDARARINYDDGSYSVGATAAIRWRKDSVLWVSMRKLGFEVGRALITRDSVFVVDRINNQYLAKSLSYLARTYNLPADFQVVQSVLLGNPFFFSLQGFRSEVDSVVKHHHLYGRDGHMETHYWMRGADYLLRRMAFNDLLQGRRFDITFDEYERAAKKQNFSYFRTLELESEETGKMSIGIRFSQIEINVPKNISFEIPDKYTRID
jgi:hypothetical protein